jgi:hypothetical protein
MMTTCLGSDVAVATAVAVGDVRKTLLTGRMLTLGSQSRSAADVAAVVVVVAIVAIVAVVVEAVGNGGEEEEEEEEQEEQEEHDEDLIQAVGPATVAAQGGFGFEQGRWHRC